MASSDDIITACGLVVHPHEHVVVIQGRELDLTTREFEIVMRLVEHPGWVFSAEQLSTENDAADYSPESVSVLVSRLRHKLARAGAHDVVETVRGLGYRLRMPLRDGEESCSGAGASLYGSVRDASWQLQEAVIEVEHSGSDEQRQAAVEALDRARRTIYTVLAE